MGELIYGRASIAIDFDDRVLAHRTIVILNSPSGLGVIPEPGTGD